MTVDQPENKAKIGNTLNESVIKNLHVPVEKFYDVAQAALSCSRRARTYLGCHGEPNGRQVGTQIELEC